ATLRLYRESPDLAAALPTLRLLARPLAELEAVGRMAAPLVAARLGDGYRVEVVAADGEVGSGAVPVVPLPSRALAIDHPDVPADRIAARFRAARPPVIGRVHDGRFLLDLRAVFDAREHAVDCVLFTVAADDGVMPQTEEHLDILHLLGVRRGIFVITKIDLVDAARVAAVREEIEILTLDTTLESAPIVPVSTVTGEGLDVLRREIDAQLSVPPGPPPPGYFRMPVDRAFVIRGHGVVVTGTAIAGTVSEGEVIRVLPGGEQARVRGLESHGAAVATAVHGQRVAMNLAGIDREDLGRGHVVCHERIARVTDRLDARVELRPAARRPLPSYSRVRFHLGTAEVIGKLIVLGPEAALEPRTTGWAQIVLPEPVLAMRGDRFILRDETARWTIGGGEVVNPFASRHRRSEAGLVERLEIGR